MKLDVEQAKLTLDALRETGRKFSKELVTASDAVEEILEVFCEITNGGKEEGITVLAGVLGTALAQAPKTHRLGIVAGFSKAVLEIANTFDAVLARESVGEQQEAQA